METVLILILLCIALDIAPWRWGFDSTEQIDSPEWERRWIWAASFRQDDENHVRDEEGVWIAMEHLLGKR